MPSPAFLSRELSTAEQPTQQQHSEERTETRKRLAKQQKQLRQAHRAAALPLEGELHRNV